MVVIELEGTDADSSADDEALRQRHSIQPVDRPYVELLDIGGSKEYATARPVFYTNRDLDAVIFVYDLADAASQTTYVRAPLTCLYLAGQLRRQRCLDGANAIAKSHRNSHIRWSIIFTTLPQLRDFTSRGAMAERA